MKRRKPIDLSILLQLKEDLSLKRADFVEIIENITNKNGISKRTIDFTFSKGLATDDTQWMLLDACKYRNEELIKNGRVNPGQIQIPQTLRPKTNSPGNSLNISKRKQQKETDDNHIVMTRFEPFSELEYSIRNSKQPQILYSLSIDGCALLSLMNGITKETLPLIEKIIVHGWNEPIRFIENFLQHLPVNAPPYSQDHVIREISYGLGISNNIPIDFNKLKRKPKIYALMYGDGPIYYGLGGERRSVGAFASEKDTDYREIGTPMCKLLPSPKAQYQEYKNLLTKGKCTFQYSSQIYSDRFNKI
ncbi:MAG: hypothetical protein K9N55_17055 [Phycisphaerae bacterium]|nr:hypothetical protein [Phycisphaerae bacterium]